MLDRKFGIAPDDDSVLLSDDQIERIIDNYIRAAKIAHRVGFRFVDVKHCHGYLGHEVLSAHTRDGKFGGSLENRTRLARQIILGIQAECPGMMIGVRLSAFDHPPFKPDPTRGGDGKLGPGIPEEFQHLLPYRYGFGCNPDNPMEIDLAEPIAFIHQLGQMGVRLINISCASPYYNPHFQRPAIFPPSDGYQPPEDPLVGVARHIHVTRDLKHACPDSISSAADTRIFRNIFHKSHRRLCETAGRILSVWADWCWPTGICPPTHWPAHRRRPSDSAAPSAIARPLHATVLSADAIRWMRITRTRRSTNS